MEKEKTLFQPSRRELRCAIFADKSSLPIDTKNYEIKIFEQPFSYTFYLGSNGNFPEGFALRIRTYGDSLFNHEAEVSVLEGSMPCFLEIKYPPINGSPHTREKVRHETTFEEALMIAQSYDKMRELFGEQLPEEIKEKIKLFYSNHGSIYPICGVSYKRIHFHNNTHRITMDFNINNFGIVAYDGNWFVRRFNQQPEEFSILEIKSDPPINKCEETVNISKFSIAKEASGKVKHIEPNMQMLAEGDWVLKEREIKIDTIDDPREILKQIRGNEEISVGSWKEKEPTLMQFVIVGRNGICIMGREGVTSRMAIKYKITISSENSSENGVLTRIERVQPFSEERLKEIIIELGADPDTIERTAYFSRHRVIRLVTCKKTGNIFAITADHCVSEANIPPLNQVEIEYRGKITSINETSMDQVDQKEVDEDFRRVSLWVYQEYYKRKQVPQFSNVTKYEWATGKTQMTERFPKNFQQGNNARIVEIDEKNQTITKSYDLWGVLISPEEVLANYQEFRRQAAKLYKLPKLIKIELDNNNKKLLVTEELIKGQMATAVLATGDEKQIVQFICAALQPLVGQIIENTTYDLGPDRQSRRPLILPMDIKPDNFIITDTGDTYFIDLFPPLNRAENGLVVTTYGVKDNEHNTWVYGEASVLITRFLMRCIRANPDKAELMTQTVLKLVQEIDPTGLLLLEMKKNANREKTITDFGNIRNGKESLSSILSF